jgi:DNA-entry nuclease|nr:DNA/RNA non-specific endonuclease [Enterocloster bolteae]
MRKFLICLLTATYLLSGCSNHSITGPGMPTDKTSQFHEAIERVAESLATAESSQSQERISTFTTWNGQETVPVYSGEPYTELNGNIPYFTDREKTEDVFEHYSDLDTLGRCGAAYANICKELMPTEKRGEIGMIKPTGWHTVRYDDIISDKYLYNRCHLIGFQLAGENANEKNLVTGTRYMNVDGMLPFENMIADYVKETDNHVLYRVTPIFVGDDLVCRGVEMEAYSVEDNGEGTSFHVFVYNIQPGIEIDYATGDSWVANSMADIVDDTEEHAQYATTLYVINAKTRKFHFPDCDSVGKISKQNKKERETDRAELIAEGYTPCGSCKP